MVLGAVKIILCAINSDNFSRKLDLSSSSNLGNEAMSHAVEEKVSVISLTAAHVNQSASVGSIGEDQILDVSNTTNLGHQRLHQYQCAVGEPTMRALTRVSSNVYVSHSSIELPPKDWVFATEHSAVETIESVTNIENSCQGPPSPYQELVIEGDAAREVYSNITNDSYSIQEQSPVYQVSFTRDSKLEVIQNFTNN